MTAAEQVVTSINPEITALTASFNELKQNYQQHTYPSVDERVQLLKQIKKSMLEHEQAFYQALSEDYGYRSEFDSMLGDFLPSIENFNYAIKKIKKMDQARTPQFRLSLIPFIGKSTLINRSGLLALLSAMELPNLPKFGTINYGLGSG